MAAIETIEGIGETYGKKLRDAGVDTCEKLLETGKDRPGRKALADKTDLTEKQMLSWVNMADLCRIKGVAGEFSELLEASGVDTVKELATRRADNLAAKMAEVNADKKLTRAVPSEKQVEGWITEAKNLPPMVTH